MTITRSEVEAMEVGGVTPRELLFKIIYNLLERAETAEAHEREWQEAFRDVPGECPDDKRNMLGGSVVQWGLSRCPDCGKEEIWGLKGGRAREEVMEDMRKHVMTCPENPLVKEIEILKKEKEDLIRKNENLSEQLSFLQDSSHALTERVRDVARICGANPGDEIVMVIERAMERLRDWEDAFFGFHRPLRLNTGITPWETKRGLETVSRAKYEAQAEALKERREAIRDRDEWIHRYNMKNAMALRLERDLAEAQRRLGEQEKRCGKCIFRGQDMAVGGFVSGAGASKSRMWEGKLTAPVSGEMPKEPRVVIVASTPGTSGTKVQEEMLGSFKRAAQQTPFMVTVNGKDMDSEARKVIVRILGEAVAGQRDINGAVFYGEGAGVTIDLSNRKG